MQPSIAVRIEGLSVGSKSYRACLRLVTWHNAPVSVVKCQGTCRPGIRGSLLGSASTLPWSPSATKHDDALVLEASSGHKSTFVPFGAPVLQAPVRPRPRLATQGLMRKITDSPILSKSSRTAAATLACPDFDSSESFHSGDWYLELLFDIFLDFLFGHCLLTCPVVWQV